MIIPFRYIKTTILSILQILAYCERLILQPNFKDKRYILLYFSLHNIAFYLYLSNSWREILIWMNYCSNLKNFIMRGLFFLCTNLAIWYCTTMRMRKISAADCGEVWAVCGPTKTRHERAFLSCKKKSFILTHFFLLFIKEWKKTYMSWLFSKWTMMMPVKWFWWILVFETYNPFFPDMFLAGHKTCDLNWISFVLLLI